MDLKRRTSTKNGPLNATCKPNTALKNVKNITVGKNEWVAFCPGSKLPTNQRTAFKILPTNEECIRNSNLTGGLANKMFCW